MITPTQIEDHPIADIFPLMEEIELNELIESIRDHGLREPIRLYEDKIIDGRNRYRACMTVGVAPITCSFEGNAQEAIALVWDSNRIRRHLSPSQAAMADARREKMLKVYAPVKAAAKERQRKHGGTVPGRPKETPPESVPEVKAGDRETRTLRAKAAGTNAKYIDLADQLVEKHPDLAEQVERGEKSLTQVGRELREEKREQQRNQNAIKISKAQRIEDIQGLFTTIVADPPWSLEDEGGINQLGRAKQDYESWPIERIKELPINKLADNDCHLYLWITNRSLPKGFRLLEAWDFRYIVMLTWPKPSFGMGNYFRGQTEHVLFGVKGSLPLKRKNASTLLPPWKRGTGGHSSKPIEIYDFIESCSPGPYLELFSRGEARKNWTLWGEMGIINE